ncbi:MAG TPA: hypothetical protein VFG73_10775 [Rhodanobacteraceae bacterium]|nr:hypothetical protein [Rhodanobacteraceae bacterium]
MATSMAAGAATTWTVTTNQDDAPPGVECNTSTHQCYTLRDAIFSAQDGDTIQFNLSGYALPATITLQNAEPLEIDTGLTIHGPGFDKLSVSGAGASRVFFMPNGAANAPEVAIDHLTITAGWSVGATGAPGADATTPGANGGGGGKGGTGTGGCIYLGTNNTLHLAFDLVTNCLALGGPGGHGGAGAAGTGGADGANNRTGAPGEPGAAGGTGGVGGTGGDAHGGAITAGGTLFLDSTTISNSFVDGGPGGDGGSGGSGGRGGTGGNSPCALVDGVCLPVGSGGTGGDGGQGGDGGAGGSMGWAAGGAIYGGGVVTLVNSTLAGNHAITGLSFFGPGATGGDGGEHGAGGDAGAGGNGNIQGPTGTAGASGAGGVGGGGGVAEGGALFNWNQGDTYSLLVHTSIGYNDATTGSGGQGADGSAAGADGFSGGGGIENHNNAKLTLSNSIVAANQIAWAHTAARLNNCNVQGDSDFEFIDDNLSDDTSCGTPDTQGDPMFAPPRGSYAAYAWGGNGLPVLMPLPGSPAINGAKGRGFEPSGDGCAAVANDERGVTRPRGKWVYNDSGIGVYHPAACALGAVESGILFRDGFDGSQ